ncbi:MAG: bifunctional 4-hydroxy-2-oxoglutarate aldolase/2-dehydro-3-deoxy-phosphogluconate aldolase, partial [Rectinema sp.]|nr:bifunctional 4-hydroxy-2-oxoglutarate aldolase/2-dehydro-3-deoxy-phosphogluconate aldolase [Rectinema sp.]
MTDFRTLFYESAIIPVIKIESPEKTDGLAGALRAGGLHIAEVTFRTKAAPAVIERFARHHGDIVVGAGTVTSKADVDAALSAGASFIVSPGFNPVICEYCLEKGVPIFPGVNTPSLIEQAMGMGLSILKFFPAEVSGGTKALKAFESVYPQVSFIPTGGIQEANINEYLGCKNVIACGGSWIVPTDAIEAGRFEEIEGLIRSCRRTIMGFLPLSA